MQITTLGPLAVDGRPVRGERLAAVVRELVDARGRAVSTSRWWTRSGTARRPTTRPAPSRRWCPGCAGSGCPWSRCRAATGCPPTRSPSTRSRPARWSTRRAPRSGAVTSAPPAAWPIEARALFPEVPELVTRRGHPAVRRRRRAARRGGTGRRGPVRRGGPAPARRAYAARRAVRRPARPGARRAGPRRGGAGGGRAAARRAGRPVRHRPVAGDHRGPPGAAARRAHRPARRGAAPATGADHAARRVAAAGDRPGRAGAGRRGRDRARSPRRRW